MLEWYIEVGEELRELRKALEMRECEDIWVEVIDSIGEVSLDRIDRLEHLDETRLTIDICAVSGRIL